MKSIRTYKKKTGRGASRKVANRTAFEKVRNKFYDEFRDRTVGDLCIIYKIDRSTFYRHLREEREMVVNGVASGWTYEEVSERVAVPIELIETILKY